MSELCKASISSYFAILTISASNSFIVYVIFSRLFHAFSRLFVSTFWNMVAEGWNATMIATNIVIAELHFVQLIIYLTL